jgi:hypothetical protein
VVFGGAAGVGRLVGWKAMQRINAAPDEWTGRELAMLGMGLSIFCWIVGYGWLIFDTSSEKPAGYEWITYDKLQPDPNMPAEPIPQTALDMQDKRVYIKGFMKARRQQTGIKEFVLCPSNGECPFCNPDPKPTEMIRVILQGDMQTNFTTHQIGVGGRFQVDQADSSGIPYAIEAVYIR